MDVISGMDKEIWNLGIVDGLEDEIGGTASEMMPTIESGVGMTGVISGMVTEMEEKTVP